MGGDPIYGYAKKLIFIPKTGNFTPTVVQEGQKIDISDIGDISLAVYGVFNDVTEYLNKQSGQTITADNSMSGDPIPGKAKNLLVVDENNNKYGPLKEGQKVAIPVIKTEQPSQTSRRVGSSSF